MGPRLRAKHAAGGGYRQAMRPRRGPRNSWFYMPLIMDAFDAVDDGHEFDRLTAPAGYGALVLRLRAYTEGQRLTWDDPEVQRYRDPGTPAHLTGQYQGRILRRSEVGQDAAMMVVAMQQEA